MDANVSQNSAKNDFERSLISRASYNGYKDLFQSVYEFGGAIMAFCLAFSAMLSAKFYASWFAFLGEGAIFAGGIVAAAIAYFIYDLHHKAVKYRSAQKRNEPVLTSLLWGLVALSIYADLSGGAEWGASLTGEAPADAKTAELGGIYGPQIEAINKEIEGIEGREFHWCGTHNQAHKCESAQFYVDPVSDKKHVARINTLKAQRDKLQADMSGLLSQAGEAHGQATKQHYEKLERNQGTLRGAGIIAVLVALLLGYWRHDYESRAIGEIRSRPAFTPSEMSEAEKKVQELEKEMQEMREERAANKDHLATVEERLKEAQDKLRQEIAEEKALKMAGIKQELIQEPKQENKQVLSQEPNKRVSRARAVPKKFSAGARVVLKPSISKDLFAQEPEQELVEGSKAERMELMKAEIRKGQKATQMLSKKYSFNFETVNKAKQEVEAESTPELNELI